MKFLMLFLMITVSGCTVYKTEMNNVHPETEYHINNNIDSFIQLVGVIRNVKSVTPEVKNKINNLVFNAGLVSQCDNKYGCYLIRPGNDGKIRIDTEFITIDYGTRYVKVEDVSEAVRIIYG